MADLEGQLDDFAATVDGFLADRLPDLNRRLEGAGLEPLAKQSFEEWKRASEEGAASSLLAVGRSEFRQIAAALGWF